MRAMLLAAGYGRRMRPLTDTTPKPLLPLAGVTLLARHLENLRAGGFKEIVVNAGWLGEQISTFCGDGSSWDLSIALSIEPEPLETAGGIIQALPLLTEVDASCSPPFLVVNADIYCPYPFATLTQCRPLPGGAHLVLVPNPAHHPEGDFILRDSRVVAVDDVDHADDSGLTSATSGMSLSQPEHFTYSGIGVYHPDFFRGYAAGVRPLRPLLESAIARGLVTGELWAGPWEDVGTPQRLADLDQRLRSTSNL